jgi:hypothetical protein
MAHGAETLNQFISFMQNYSKDAKMKTELKYTFETASAGNSLSFLDMLVKIRDSGSLETNLYSKETDAYVYLRQNSCHPKSCIEGLIKGELLCARRICTKQEDFLESAEKMKGYLLEIAVKDKQHS